MKRYKGEIIEKRAVIVGGIVAVKVILIKAQHKPAVHPLVVVEGFKLQVPEA
jgi:hypothetical protein